MVNHKEVYINFFGFDIGDFVPCIGCGGPSVEVHHIDARKMGGSKCKDYIENLASICRTCHTRAEKDARFNKMIRAQHLRTVADRLEETC